MKIVIPDLIDMPEVAQQKLRDMGAELYFDTPDEATLIGRVKDAEIITANWIDVPAAVIDACPHLKCIVASAVGYNHIDVAHAASKGIKVLNCPTYHARAVAEHAVALLFATARKLSQAMTSLKNGEWADKQELLGTELQGKRLGIVGYGRVGKEIAGMARALGMQVQFANSRTDDTELDALLSQSDTVCLCLPLTESTERIIDARRLKLLKPSAILVNVGRGATVDQATLYQMLRDGELAGAGLDVFENEPLEGKATEPIVQLASLPNVTATPHIGYNTEETIARLGDELIANLQSCLDGQPRNVVN